MMTMHLAVTALVLGFQTTKVQAPPKEPDEPFAIYVFTDAPGDPDDGNSLGRTTEEVAKKVRDRNKWFRLVENREEADIVVEVLVQSEGQTDSETYVPRETNDPSKLSMAVFSDVKDQFSLLTRIYVPKGDPIDMSATSTGRRPKDAAKPFARRLEMFCRQNYWTLLEALER